jgi:hypothetical protein
MTTTRVDAYVDAHAVVRFQLKEKAAKDAHKKEVAEAQKKAAVSKLRWQIHTNGAFYNNPECF